MKTIIIKELGIEVETELRPRVKKADIKIPEGWRLLTFSESAVLLEDYYEETKIGYSYEWVDVNGRVSALVSDYGDDKLLLGGYGGVGGGGLAFGVRFCRDVKRGDTS